MRYEPRLVPLVHRRCCRSAATLLLTVLVTSIAGTHSARAIDLKDLNVPASRIPAWYAFDKSVYDAARSWPEYDVTCASAPCASGKKPFTDDPRLAGTCTAVSTSDFSSMDCMVDHASDESVLYIPSGVYSVGAREGMTIGRSNIVVRGAGPTQTVLSRNSPGWDAINTGFCTSGSGAHIASICSPTWKGVLTTWTSGFSTGTTVVTVGNASSFSPGGWIMLRMSGSTSCEYMDKTQNAGADCDGFVHIAKITTINGNDITIDRGLRMNYVGNGCSGHTAQVYDPVTNVGIEELRLTSDTVPVCGDSATCIRYTLVSWRGAANSWLVDAKLDRTWELWTFVQYSARLWIQGNDFDDLDETISWNTEGMYVAEGGVDIVHENNTCRGTRVCQKIEKGAEGNVTAYNYFRQSQSLCERSYFNHGHYSRENLFEGNDVNCTVELADDWWGRNGPRITAYRNRNVSTVCDGGRDAMTLDGSLGADWPTADHPNFIANVSAQFPAYPVMSCPPSNGVKDLSLLSDDLWMERNVWTLPGGTFEHGSENNRSCGTAPNDSCPGTNVNRVSPDPAWANLEFPTSLYRTSPPSWWCQEACPWSQSGIGAFGDDFSGQLCKLPAQIRLEGGTCTPLGATASEPPPGDPPPLGEVPAAPILLDP